MSLTMHCRFKTSHCGSAVCNGHKLCRLPTGWCYLSVALKLHRRASWEISRFALTYKEKFHGHWGMYENYILVLPATMVSWRRTYEQSFLQLYKCIIWFKKKTQRLPHNYFRQYSGKTYLKWHVARKWNGLILWIGQSATSFNMIFWPQSEWREPYHGCWTNYRMP